MPGPHNSIKKKKQKRKGKPKSNGDCTKAVDSEQNNPKSDPVPATIKGGDHIVVNNDKITKKTDRNSTVFESYPSEIRTQKPDHYQSEDTVSAISAVSALNTPFVTDGGDGPRVKDIEKYLSSFFCPPVSLDNHDCARYDRVEILTVLKSTLPHEFALNVWFNKSRTFNRICPACQRLYRLGDSLLDPVNGGMLCIEDPNTPYQVLREQRISGICSMPCFLLACYSSYPYTMEVVSGSWGLLHDELDARTRSLIDATDPQTAALMRYGISTWTPTQEDDATQMTSDRALGRIMRMTRRKDLGLGEVFEALAWYDEENMKISQVQSN